MNIQGGILEAQKALSATEAPAAKS